MGGADAGAGGGDAGSKLKQVVVRPHEHRTFSFNWYEPLEAA